MYLKSMLGTTLVVATICQSSSADILVNQDQFNVTQGAQPSLYKPGINDIFVVPPTDNRMADDFTLAQPATVTGVNVRGVISDLLGSGIPTGWIVNFYSGNGQAGLDQQYPAASVFSQTLSGGQVIYGSNGLVQLDFSGTPFDAAAATKYWISVQAVGSSSPGSTLSWTWSWNNDPSGPPASGTYAPNGSAAASYSGTWGNHWGKWSVAGQFPGDPSTWVYESYAETTIPDPKIRVDNSLGFPLSLPSGTSPQRLDLNFQLIGTFAAVPEPSTLMLGSMGLVAMVSAARRRQMAK